MIASWSLTPRLMGILCSTLVLALSACEQTPPPEPPPRFKEVFHLNTFEKDFGYAQAVKVGRTLYVSGCVAVDAQGKLVAPGDMAAQLRAVYQNLRATLKAHGAGFEHVVRENIFTTNMDALLKVADLRFDYYSKEGLPAGTWVQVERLVDPGFLVAIEVTAELP
jgi:2-iminobutanoate/2-iminopropanoate deaminase